MTACFGRERELAWVLSRLEATSAGGAAMVSLTGPAGIGKSRLLDELRDQARAGGFVVLEGWCVRWAAYSPFMSVVAQSLAWLRGRGEQDLLGAHDLAALAPLVSARPRATRGESPEDSPEEAAIRFTEAVGRLLAAVGRQRPVMVLLRGYGRADEATRALVRALLDAAGPIGEPTPATASALIVTGVRDDVSGVLPEHPRAERLSLEGIGLEGVRKVLADESVITRLHAITAGHPETLLAMLDRLPPPREAEVLARVSELGELPRKVVAALAAADRPLPVAVIAATLGVDAEVVTRAVPGMVAARVLWRALDPAAADVVHGLHRGDDGAAVLSELSPSDRSALHRALGIALEQWGRVAPEESVLHRLAGDAPHDVAQESVLVARSLLRRHAPASAMALVRAVDEHAPAEVLRALADIASTAAGMIGAEREAREIVARAESANPEVWELARTDAALCLVLGDADGARDALARAESRAAGDPAALGSIAATRAEWFYLQGRHDDVEREAQRAIELCASDESVVTRARNTLTKTYLVRNDLAKGWSWARESLERALARGERTEVLRGYINLGVVAIRRGDLDEAARQFEAARGFAQRGGVMMLRGVLRENEAVVAHMRGRFGDALTYYQEALGILARVGNRRFLARVAHNLGELYVHVGEVTRARRLCEYAEQVAGGLSGSLAAEGLMLRAQVEIADGRTDAARAALTDALAEFSAAGDLARQWEVYLLCTRAALVDGDTDRAESNLRRVPDGESEASARMLAERAGLESEVARARGRETFSASLRALELAEHSGDADLRFAAHVALALALCDRGDDAAARRHRDLAEVLRNELLAPVPEALRVTYSEKLSRAGFAQLAVRLEVLARTERTAVRPEPASAVGADALGLVGDGAAMRELRRRIVRVAPQDVTVLLRGESGTGKERVAEALHHGSRRRTRELVKVNCAALAEGVLLSELFGHEKGAFTGADRRRRGRFELADGGTIFLDEIGDVTPATQAALLRVLQERTFERVGGNETLRVDVRVIAATNRELEAMVKDGGFREDLYFRLTSLTIQLPPLRERLEDLAQLAAYILDREHRATDMPLRRLTASALRRLMEHPWPGNVRELENVLRASALMADGDELRAEDIEGIGALPRAEARPQDPIASVRPPPMIGSNGAHASQEHETDVVYEKIRHGGVSLFDMRRELERGCIARALEESGGNITRAAALLGMKRPRLSQLVAEYGLAKGAPGVNNPDL